MEENTNEKKKQKVVILIGLVTLLIAVLGATYAYFQISTNTESSNTNITGKTPPKSLVTLTQGTSNLHLNISASDMSYENRTKEYYGTDVEEKAYEENESDGTKTIASVELSGGEETTKYSCTAKLTVSKITEPLEEADTMIEVLQPGDMILQFKGNIISEQLDLSDLKGTGTKEYNLSFKITGNKVENIQAYIKLLNKNEPQNYLAGKKLNVDISTSELQCEVFIPEPSMVTLRKNDTQKYLSEDIQGDMYRYQATFENGDSSEMTNWICFGTTENCSSSEDNIDKYMYRIIGITEEGEIKLIKDTGVKNNGTKEFAWHDEKRFSDPYDGESGKCDGEKCDWPNSLLFKRLNGLSSGTSTGTEGNTNIFLGTSDHPSDYEYLTEGTKWYNLIEERDWIYGYTSNYYEYSSNLLAKDAFEIETGIKSTTRKWPTLGKGMLSQYIKNDDYKYEKKIKSRIGLMYIHDYLYAYYDGENNNSRGVPGTYTEAMKSWIFYKNETLNSSFSSEFLLSAYGVEHDDNEYASACAISRSGYIYGDDLIWDKLIRPTFYLNSDVNIKSGDGTKSNPYILDI